MGGRKSDKKYTNEAWTKRVDHAAGRHRTRRASDEPLVCEVCGDIYADRRWSFPVRAKGRQKPTTLDISKREWVAFAEGHEEKKHSRGRPPQVVVCPACQRQREGVPSGFVHLDGAYLNAHLEEIRRLLEQEAERAAEDNPLARIMRWEKDEHTRLTLATTTEHLAQRLGHALKKAFKGKVHYDFSHENKLAHVYWQRD
jgi:hypothetical protein